MKAYIYARYSDHTQKDTSIEQQFREIREYAERNNIQIIGEYADRAISGTTDKRPEFQRMIRDTAKGHVQIVIVWKVDRFARNRYDSAMYKARLKKNGVRVLYAKESIPDGPEGILLESILEGSAEYYSANLSQNVRRGMKENALECKVNSGAIPLGYRKGPDGRFEIVPEEAEIVREIFQLYSQGVNLTKISAAMNSRGIRTKHGAKFGKNSFRTILKNERYTGVYLYGGVRVEGGMPAIISKELFDKVQKRVAWMKHAPASARTEIDYILTGKMFCGICGSPMIGDHGCSQNSGKYYYYSCGKKRLKRACPKKSIRKDWIEGFIVEQTRLHVLQDDVIDRIADAVVDFQKKEQKSSLLPSLEQRLSEIRKSIANMIAAIEQGIITPSTKQRLAQLEAEKSDLEISIEKEKIVKPVFSKEQIVYWISQFKDGNIDDEEYKKSIIQTFINAVYLYDDKIKIVYNYSGENNSLDFALIDKCDTPENSILTRFSPPKKEYPNFYLIKGMIVLVLGIKDFVKRKKKP